MACSWFPGRPASSADGWRPDWQRQGRRRQILGDTSRGPEPAGVEAAETSCAVPAARTEAVAGPRVFFMVSGAGDRDRLRRHGAAVDAAVEAGVGRDVYLSCLGAAPDAAFARGHYHTEQHIRATGPGSTFLRGNRYRDMPVLMAGPGCVVRGRGAEPWSATT